MMRCSTEFFVTKILPGRHLVVAVFACVLAACGKSSGELQAEIEALKSQVEKQGALLEEVRAFHQSHGSLLEQMSAWQDVGFRVDNVSFDVVEEAFEPLVVGKADLTLVGDARPELIFVEWAVTVRYKDKLLDPATYIQRVENGTATLKIFHPLPSHGIRKKDLSLQVKPTGWYLAHVAQTVE